MADQAYQQLFAQFMANWESNDQREVESLLEVGATNCQLITDQQNPHSQGRKSNEHVISN